jgi:hypothetical protein
MLFRFEIKVPQNLIGFYNSEVMNLWIEETSPGLFLACFDGSDYLNGGVEAPIGVILTHAINMAILDSWRLSE